GPLPSLSGFRNCCVPAEIRGFCVAKAGFIGRQNGAAGCLPGSANATIRSPAASGSIAVVPIWHGIVASLNPLICRTYLFDMTAKRQCPDRVGHGSPYHFAPFVYRLGRHPFTVERAVRFR